MDSPCVIVLGAGVVGLTTALSFKESYPNARVLILAKHFPGDYAGDYTSPWAGGNWCSSANDDGLLEKCDRVTFERFSKLATESPEAGIQRSPLQMIFDQQIEDAGILSKNTNKIWYEELVGGLEPISKSSLPSKAVFGYNVKSTFVINTQIYLRWLLKACLDNGISVLRSTLNHIDDCKLFPGVTAVFNCTGLGAYFLGGVEDKTMYPTRGQTVLVEQPLQPLETMYFRSPARVDNDTTYVFQRPMAGGIVLGGCREDGNWNTEVDPEFAKDIMKRCCALAPELGRPEDLKIIKHGVGLRPNRKNGPRLESERRSNGLLVVHNYGASGAGYQASWGMAEHSVRLYDEAEKKKTFTASL
ncbi:FAD dependent oxidoreductase [Xylariales sp. PMI_506]|nr:FAD dependent oxidoreductase [Xylariales sp. PMI_506]